MTPRAGAANRRDPSIKLARFDTTVRNREGVERICGIDEAGRGALAGPVVAGAVVLEPGTRLPGLNDSKALRPARREALYLDVARHAAAAAVGWATADEVDRLNVLQATHLAAHRALQCLAIRPEWILTDALKLEGCEVPVEPLVKGDARSLAIAAASILAKVTRDRWMVRLHEQFPHYGLAGNKGYGTEIHLEALREKGASTIHRHTFRGVEWFDRPHLRSVRLAQLLERLEAEKAGPESPEEVWRCEDPLLPEAEETLFIEACATRNIARIQE